MSKKYTAAEDPFSEMTPKERQDFDDYCVARGTAIKESLSSDYHECLPLEEGFALILDCIKKNQSSPNHRENQP